jgi:hypothetical protein
MSQFFRDYVNHKERCFLVNSCDQRNIELNE